MYKKLFSTSVLNAATASTTVLPKVKIGKNVIIGAGLVVTKDIPDNCMTLGIPAKVMKCI